MPMSPFAREIMQKRYCHEGETSWRQIAKRVARNVLGAVNAPKDLVRECEELIALRKFMPGGRYLAAAGREAHQTQNCFLLRAEDTRQGWADVMHNVTMITMTGGGVGVDYSNLRGKGIPLKRAGGYSSGPLALMQMVNEAGRGAMAGGSRRAAIWAGLRWDHPDILDFIRMKDWPVAVRALKDQDFNFPAMMDFTNISVGLNDGFLAKYQADIGSAREVWRLALRLMLETAEPGFSIDVGEDAEENLRNPCTEITSRDDSDTCNLGSINLARIKDLGEMRKAVEVGTAFLLAGTVYSDVPYPKVAEVRAKNRRLGLGIMGFHEWLLMNGKKYGPDPKLERFLEAYATSTATAAAYADKWGLSAPVKTRALAPNGTIGIVAETTTGIEPIFCAAYRRRYFDRGVWRAQYVLDPAAKRLVAEGISPDAIEDAYILAADVERRVTFQAWVQKYVDHAISSTINLPAWGSDLNNQDKVKDFGDMLMRYLPQLRGLTCYPDGARGGQPLERVDFREALEREGEVVTEQADVCDLRAGGSCGS